MSKIRAQTISSLKWNIATQIIVQGSNLVIGVILARLLSPEEFGLISMVTVLTGFALVFRDSGLGSAIIQKKKITEADLSSAFWFNIMAGGFISLVIFFCSPLVASFYDKSILIPITQWIALDFFLNAFTIVQSSRLMKELAFRKLFFVHTLAVVLAGNIAIYMAFNGYGVWSLLWKMIITTILTNIMLIIIGRWKPQFVISRDSLKDLFSFSLPLLGTQSLNYWTRNVDNLLIGKYLGDAALGYYGRAYAFMLLPVRHISGVISQVLFPSFSLIQDDTDQIKRIYLKITRVISFITFPMMFGLSVLAEPFVITILGEQWRGMIPVLRILAILGATQSIGTLNGNIFLSQGATRLQFRVGLITKTIMITAIVLGLKYGIEGVALSYTVASLLIMLPLYYIVGSLINLPLKKIVLNLAPTLLISLVMCMVVHFIDLYLKVTLVSYIVRLIFGIGIGVSFYAVANVIIKPVAYNDIVILINSQKR